MERLLAATGVSGFENPICEIIQELVSPHITVETDSLGNLFGSIGEGSPHILLIAHMDELGLVVTHIEENGCLRFRTIGGIDDRILPSRSVFVHTKSGPVRGVIGMIPPHLIHDRAQMKQVVSWSDLYIDLCTRSKAETEALGVRLLDPVTLEKDSFVLQGKYLGGRAIDDRFGCAVLIKLLEKLAPNKQNRKITFVWSAQEEIGLHGATVMGNRFVPDIVIAVDSYATGDAPDVPFHLAPVRLGDGPVLRLLDNRAIASPYLRDQFETIAQAQKLPLQCGATGGGTDGAAIQRAGSGALMMAISVAVRYLHSTVELCHLDDLQNLVTLLNAALPQLSLPDTS
jgi:putative aminopeptidase FrvX